MTTETLPWGDEQLSLTLPAKVQVLRVREPQNRLSPARFKQDLRQCLINRPLNLSNPVIVVADKTRLCGYPQYLPLLIAGLQDAGMRSESLRIIIAYGTHPPQSDAECREAYGESFTNHSFIHHNCGDRDTFVDRGTSSRGTPIRLRKDLAGASAIITMGAVCHHYFAGYGGGRKLIFPGCGEREAIYTNHGLYLDRQAGILSPGCQPGNFRDNPLAEDLFEIEAKLPAHLAIHGILDSHGSLCELLIGSPKDAAGDVFQKACAKHGHNCETASEKFQTVVASCGGHPKDINLIQAHKAIHNGAMFVADGGLLLLYAECRDGLGSTTFLPWFDKGSFEAAFTELSAGYEGNGGTALAMMTKLRRIRIGLITRLDTGLCDKIGVENWRHRQVLDYLEQLPGDHSLAVIPNASLLVNANQ